jgi:hypothetical protein
MVGWLEGVGISSPALHLSPVALCFTFTPAPSKKGVDHLLPGILDHVGGVLYGAAVAAGTAWPILMIADLQPRGAGTDVAEGERDDLRRALDALADDPTWHRGQIALFVTPLQLASPSAEGSEDEGRWRGPTDADQLRELLLDHSPIGGAVEVKRVTVHDLARAIWDHRAAAEGPWDALRDALPRPNRAPAGSSGAGTGDPNGGESDTPASGGDDAPDAADPTGEGGDLGVPFGYDGSTFRARWSKALNDNLPLRWGPR